MLIFMISLICYVSFHLHPQNPRHHNHAGGDSGIRKRGHLKDKRQADEAVSNDLGFHNVLEKLWPAPYQSCGKCQELYLLQSLSKTISVPFKNFNLFLILSCSSDIHKSIFPICNVDGFICLVFTC